MDDRRAERRSGVDDGCSSTPPLPSGVRRRARLARARGWAAVLLAAAALLGPGDVSAAALCNGGTFSRSWFATDPICKNAVYPDLHDCVVMQSFNCGDGAALGPPICAQLTGWGACVVYWTDPGYEPTDTSSSCVALGRPEECGNGADDDYDGCIDGGCEKEHFGDPACTCTGSCAAPSCSPVPDATCDPRKDVPEICGDGRDNDCDGRVDEDCRPPKPGDGSPPCCGCVGGQDPILLASRSAATTPHTDFAVTAVSRLDVTRTWNSLDDSFFGGSAGILGRGWHHGWEGTLTCAGEHCTVARGAQEGFRFVKAESVPSLDAAETWQLYRPEAGFEGAARRHLLARRPGGEWILFLSDGRTLHFAAACDACGAPDAYCAPPEEGGRARLVKEVDARGNAIHVSYGRGTGLLLGLTDDLGHTLELRSPTACVDGLARELQYDGSQVVRYDYDGLDLVRAVDAEGTVLRAYAYEPGGSGLVLAVLDEAWQPIVEFAYDENGDAVGIVDELTTMLVSYGDGGVVNVSETFGTLASTGTRTFDATGNLVSIAEGCSCGGAKTFTYAGGDLVCTRDPAGNITYDGRDAFGRVIRHARYEGTTCPPTTGTLGPTFEEEWRAYGLARPIAQGVSQAMDMATSVSRISGASSANKAEESWDYDPIPKAGDPLDWSCAEAPLPAGAAVCRHVRAGYALTPTGAAVFERHATFYSYDGRGRVTKVIGPVNLDRSSASDVTPVEERVYWPDGESLARRGRLAEVRRYPSPAAAPHATTFDYDMFGLYRAWEPDGRFTTHIKDGRGRTRFVLGSDGRTSETRYHDGEKPRLRIAPGGEVTRWSYDSRGRVEAEERLSGDPDVPGAMVSVLWGEHHQHDAAGNRVHSERRDASGAVVWKTDREFDVQHRLVRETHPDVPGAARTWEYDASGLLTRTVDEEGRATSFLPDHLGRVKSVTRSGVDEAGNPISSVVGAYAYQGYSGRLASLEDGKGAYVYYAYDDFGRLATIRHPQLNGGPLSHAWDARGNLLQGKDAYLTVTRSHTYDGLDRLLTTTAVNLMEGTTVGYTYRYDEDGARGWLTSVVEPERTVRFRRDAGGRLAGEAIEEKGVALALSTEYRYDSAGRLTEIVYPTGLRLLHDRDPATGEVTSLRDAVSGQVYAGGIRRAAGGPTTGLTFANGTTLSQAFNARWETTSVASGPIGLQYTPTPAGDVGSIEEAGLNLPFRHDFLGRTVASAGWFTYGSDWNGNRTSEWLEGASVGYAYTYDRLASASISGTTPLKRHAFAYDFQTNVSGIGRYDATGSRVTAAVCLRHDPLGRLVTVGAAMYPTYVAPDGMTCLYDTDLASVAARFKYDHRNRRVASWRATTNEWVYTAFDPAGQPLAELALTSDPASPWRPVREYVWLDGKPVAQIEHDPVTGAARTYAVHTDAIGMPRALTSPGGAVVWRASVPRPYGDVAEAVVPDPETGRTVVTNLRLPGQYDERLLASVGLQGPYYNWNRWYLPGVGRYLELDPIAKAGGFNTAYGVDWYNYADGNPLTRLDPTGRNPLIYACAVGVGILWGWIIGEEVLDCPGDNTCESQRKKSSDCNCFCIEKTPWGNSGPYPAGKKKDASACNRACKGMYGLEAGSFCR